MKASAAEQTISLWDATSKNVRERTHASLQEDRTVDVCVVGAGIAGMSTAYLLAKEGKSVLVLDDGPLGGGMTSRTTAHLTYALDDRYHVLADLHGERGARLAAQSHCQAIDAIESIIKAEEIDCDFLRLNGYLFNPPGVSEDDLKRELEAAHLAGLTGVKFVDKAPFKLFDTGRCLLFPQQAQFHPLKYLTGLTAAFLNAGGQICCASHVASVEGGKDSHVKTESGMVVRANHIAVCTNTPINNRLLVHSKQAAYNSYVVGLAVPPESLETALYWDTTNPYHYVRLAPGTGPKGDHVLVVGGEDHKTGQADNFEKRYADLENWIRERVPQAGKVQYRWSGEVFEPVDSLAYIGRNAGDYENVYVATGESGNGITHGTIAGILLTDLICGRKNPWTTLYDPSRITLRASVEYVKESINTAVQYADWVTPGEVQSTDEIAAGQGAVIRRGASKVACYRDEHGALHECSAVCPHLAGIVTWNHSEKTWDCPCHGSRFDKLGKVFVGPANADLPPIEEAPKSRPATDL